MPQINLLKRAKRKARKQYNMGTVWVISKVQNDKEYFVSKVDENGTTVYWKNNIKKAMRFHTEKGCEHFQKTFLEGRTDIDVKTMRDPT